MSESQIVATRISISQCWHRNTQSVATATELSYFIKDNANLQYVCDAQKSNLLHLIVPRILRYFVSSWISTFCECQTLSCHIKIKFCFLSNCNFPSWLVQSFSPKNRPWQILATTDIFMERCLFFCQELDNKIDTTLLVKARSLHCLWLLLQTNELPRPAVSLC